MGSSIRELAPHLQPYADALVQYAKELGGSAQVVSTYRSPARQQKIWNDCQRRAGTANPCKYPVARPGSSMHERRLAFDVFVTPASLYPILGAWWRSIGGTWGGDFRHKDEIHFDAR